MAASGLFTFDPTRTQIIEGALGRIGVLDPGKSASPEELNLGNYWLNLLVKSLQNEGITLWTEVWEEQPLGGSSSSEVIGTDSLNYECIRAHTSSTDDQPITGNNWRSFWEQRGSSGAAWANATAYGSAANFTLPARTIGVLKASLRQSGNQDTPIDLIAMQTYFSIPDKALRGTPRRMAIDEQHPTMTAFLHPIPDQSDIDDQEVVQMRIIRPIFDFTTNSDTSDVPQRWVHALTIGLSVELSGFYGQSPTVQRELTEKYMRLLRAAKRGDKETISMNFVRKAFC